MHDAIFDVIEQSKVVKSKILFQQPHRLIARNEDGLTPIEFAYSLRKTDFVKLLAEKILFGHKHGNALIDAVKRRDIPMVHSLIRSGASVNWQDSEGCTCLHELLKNSSPYGESEKTLFNILLTNGADLSLRLNNTPEKETPIQLAAKLGDWQSVQRLATEFKTDEKDSYGYYEVLKKAVQNRRRGDMLILLYANTNITGDLFTIATTNQDYTAVKMLTDHQLVRLLGYESEQLEYVTDLKNALPVLVQAVQQGHGFAKLPREIFNRILALVAPIPDDALEQAAVKLEKVRQIAAENDGINTEKQIEKMLLKKQKEADRIQKKAKEIKLQMRLERQQRIEERRIARQQRAEERRLEREKASLIEWQNELNTEIDQLSVLFVDKKLQAHSLLKEIRPYLPQKSDHAQQKAANILEMKSQIVNYWNREKTHPFHFFSKRNASVKKILQENQLDEETLNQTYAATGIKVG